VNQGCNLKMVMKVTFEAIMYSFHPFFSEMKNGGETPSYFWSGLPDTMTLMRTMTNARLPNWHLENSLIRWTGH